MKAKPKIEYFIEWRAVWPEPSWEPYGRFIKTSKVKEHVEKILAEGEKVRVSKITTERTVHTPKGWIKCKNT